MGVYLALPAYEIVCFWRKIGIPVFKQIILIHIKEYVYDVIES